LGKGREKEKKEAKLNYDGSNPDRTSRRANTMAKKKENARAKK